MPMTNLERLIEAHVENATVSTSSAFSKTM
jgi:hypothetical protein